MSINLSIPTKFNCNQDLHLHTNYSKHDGAIVKEQNLDLIARLRHASIVGISDHYEAIYDCFELYQKDVLSFGFHVGTEVDGHRSAAGAAALPFEYYFYHCRPNEEDYKAIDLLLATNKPVIISHPNYFGTDLSRIPKDCLLEINNRYIWRSDWYSELLPYVNQFRFVLSSDAHQPHWLNQNIAQMVAHELGIEEYILFEK